MLLTRIRTEDFWESGPTWDFLLMSKWLAWLSTKVKWKTGAIWTWKDSQNFKIFRLFRQPGLKKNHSIKWLGYSETDTKFFYIRRLAIERHSLYRERVWCWKYFLLCLLILWLWVILCLQLRSIYIFGIIGSRHHYCSPHHNSQLYSDNFSDPLCMPYWFIFSRFTLLLGIDTQPDRTLEYHTSYRHFRGLFSTYCLCLPHRSYSRA